MGVLKTGFNIPFIGRFLGKARQIANNGRLDVKAPTMTPERRTLSTDQRNFVISSQEELADLATYISSQLEPSLFPNAKPLKTFLESIYTNTGLGTIAVIDRRERYVRPIFDIYLLWSTPLDMSSETQERQMESVERAHLDLLHKLEPSLDSLLHFIDPAAYNSIGAFQTELSTGFRSAISARIIGFATLQR